MYENYGIKGHVHELKQRKQWGFSEGLLNQVQNFNSYDVEFSSAGLVLAKTSYTHGGEVHRSMRFEYNDAGQLVRSEEFDSKGEKIEIAQLVRSQGKCTWTARDASGVATNYGVDEYDGTNIVLSSSYDGKGNPKTLKSFEYEEGKLSRSVSKYYGYDGTVSEQWVRTYDAAGRVAKTFGLKAEGAPLGDGKYSHEYDEEGRKSKVWTFDDLEGVASSVRVSEYRNDGVGNWIERHDFHRSKSDSRWRKTTTTRTLTYYPLD
jgi:hypothetical protein